MFTPNYYLLEYHSFLENSNYRHRTADKPNRRMIRKRNENKQRKKYNGLKNNQQKIQKHSTRKYKQTAKQP